tara:strand:+ start:1162 stop:1800 length:639 start_codon:yes stop_codon:yes gene_type:complete
MDQKTQEHDIAAEMEFYKQSLREAEEEVVIQKRSGKAKKDIVGAEFESHRKRVWEHFGFTVETNTSKYGGDWNVDCNVFWKGKLILMEEDKAHYADKCMTDRAILDFINTIKNIWFGDEEKEIPVFLFHSFTKFPDFNHLLNKQIRGLSEDLKNIIVKNIHYTTITSKNRLKDKEWVGNKKCERVDSYTHFSEDELIVKDIMFIKSLIPVSQ